MIYLGSTTLENEMDLALAYKKSIFIADKLGLTVSTQTAFATAVSEVCRDVIDKATGGLLQIASSPKDGRFSFDAIISYEPTDKIPHPNPGFEYARKLIPVFSKSLEAGKEKIVLSLTLPRSLNLTDKKIQQSARELMQAGPINSYEEVKLRNNELQQVNLQHELELVSIKYLDEQKTEFLSIASHEINSPLTIAHSMAQIALQLDPKSSPALTGYLQKIHLHTAKLVRLTRQLLDISRLETGNFNYEREITDASLFISDMVDNLKLLCPNHKILAHLATGTAQLHIDRIKIEQVFNNVIGNAAKYSEPGTEITVHTKYTDTHLEVTVKDQGIGMSEETLSNVFGKFFRGKNERSKFSGLGMGLYVTAKIVADHNGSLSASSEPGEGAAFTFTLPLQTL